MKFSGKAQDPLTFSGKLLLKRQNASPDSDLHARKNTPRATARRRPRTPVTRLKKNGAPVGRRSRPETPLLNWKIHETGKDEVHPLGIGEDDEKPVQGSGRRASSKKGKKGREVVVSARKLAAVLWRMQLPEVGVAGEGRPSILVRNEDRLGLQHGVHHVNIPLHLRLNSLDYGSDLKNISQSPQSLCGTKDRLFSKNDMMEGATKWDPISLKTSEEANQICSQLKLPEQKISIVSVVSALEVELEQALIRIQELESERKSSKKKLEHFLRKVNEERASWRSREHEKIRAYIDDMRAELNRERKSRQRLEIVNNRLVNELADAKLLGKRYLQDYEKEREARELLEEVCDELAKEIGEDKAEIEASKRESISFKEEMEEERRMLQMAEVWREERVQMKLVDAKVALEEKYSQMNKLVKDLEHFLKSVNENPNADIKKREAEILRQAAASVNIQDIPGFRYEPSNPDDIFSIFEDPNSGEPNEKEIEPCVSYTSASHASKIHTLSPEANLTGKEIRQRHSNAFVDDNGDVEDESGWETVSQLEDQGSSYSPDGSAPSVNKNCLDCNVSRTGSPLDWEDNTGEETPITEISEVISVPKKQLKKVSSIARLWKRSCPKDGENYKIISVDATNGKLSNGRLSNGAILSPDRGSGKGGYSPRDLIGHWSSPESRNPHSIQGKIGCIPHGPQNNSLKSKLSEARMDSQKVQLRHVLKQKI